MPRDLPKKTSGAVPSRSRNGPHAVPLIESPLRQKTSRSTADTMIWLLQEMRSRRLPQKHILVTGLVLNYFLVLS